MRLKVPRERLSAASKVGGVTNLDKIYLIKSGLEKYSHLSTIPSENLVFKLSPKYSFDSGTKQLLIYVDLGLSTKQAPGKKEVKSGFQVSAVFELQYSLKIEAPPEDSQDYFFQSFASISAVHHVWPYWREYLDSCARRMGLPHFSTPLIQFLPEEDKKAEKKPAKRIASDKKPAVAKK